MEHHDHRLYFQSDYMEGAHPDVLDALVRTNLDKAPGYGQDRFCDDARERIRRACGCPDAEVFFLAGGTQTNAVVIGACLRPWQGVLAPESGHISGHEAGAVELGGHKVLTLPQANGKINADAVRSACAAYWSDENREHIVMPGMVYVSQPTELGTLYTRDELAALRNVCREYDLTLFVDGARLAYALACPDNDVSLQDLAELADVFYIGGTKCGALLGEAVVATKAGLLPHFFSVIKQHGALLAKGRVLGVQFGALFTDDLYFHIGKSAVAHANTIRSALRERGYDLLYDTPTNQIFVRLENTAMERLSRDIAFSFWEKIGDAHAVVRLCTSWATTDADVARLIELL